VVDRKRGRGEVEGREGLEDKEYNWWGWFGKGYGYKKWIMRNIAGVTNQMPYR